MQDVIQNLSLMEAAAYERIEKANGRIKHNKQSIEEDLNRIKERQQIIDAVETALKALDAVKDQTDNS